MLGASSVGLTTIGWSMKSNEVDYTLVTLPNGMSLRDFRQYVLNLYYGRDPVQLNHLLDSLKEVKNDSQVAG